MNEKYLKRLEESGISMYELAKRTGLSYSLIHDITTGKKDINDRSVRDVEKIAAVLQTSLNEIRNPFCIVEGYVGKYNGVSFHIEYEGAAKVRLQLKNQNVELDLGHQFHIPDRFYEYIRVVELEIGRQIRHKKQEETFKEMLQKEGGL